MLLNLILPVALLVCSTTSSNVPQVQCPRWDKPNSLALFVPNLEDCSSFYICSNGIPYTYRCPAGLLFNSRLNVCDYPEQANCPSWLSSNIERIEDGNVQEAIAINSIDWSEIHCPRIDLVDRPPTFFYNRHDCNKYYMCSNGEPIEFTCPAGLHFNAKINVCDWPQNAKCFHWISTMTDVEEFNTGLSTFGHKMCLRYGSTNGEAILLPNRRDCGKFYQCSNGRAYAMSCPEGLYFNNKLKVCDWPHNVRCHKRMSDDDGNEEETEF